MSTTEEATETKVSSSYALSSLVAGFVIGAVIQLLLLQIIPARTIQKDLIVGLTFETLGMLYGIVQCYRSDSRVAKVIATLLVLVLSGVWIVGLLMFFQVIVPPFLQAS